jgi:hypoxanthine phosphoribosyltransferase
MIKNFRFLTWESIDQYCEKIYKEMLKNHYKPDCIIALLRGGVVPGRIFSDYFDILLDFFALDVKLYNGIGTRNDKPVIRFFDGNVKGKKILVVDDIIDTSKTMNAVLDYLKGEDITTATLLWKETAPNKPNYYAEVAKKDEWIVFPFERHEFQKDYRRMQK